jgi:hypothetical protein
MPVERDRERQQIFDVAPAAALAAYGYRGLTARQQDAGRAEGLCRVCDVRGNPREHLAHITCLALDGIAHDVCRVARGTAHFRCRLERHLGRGDDDGLGAGEARIARLDRLAAAALQKLAHRRRHVDLVAPQDAERVRATGRIGHRRSRCDVDRAVAGNIRDQQCEHARRMACSGKTAALDAGQVAPHAVDLADGGAGGQQRARECLFDLEREPRRGQRQQRRPAARDEAEHEIVRRQPPDAIEHPLCAAHAGRIGNGMSGLHDLDPPAGHRVSVARHHEPGERPAPLPLHRLRHRRRSLPRSDHDQPPSRRRRQMPRYAHRRLRGGNRRAKHCLQHRTRRALATGHHFGEISLRRQPPSLG